MNSEPTTGAAPEDGRGSKARATIKIVAFVAVIGGLFALSNAFDLGESFRSLQGWIGSLGVLAPIVYIGIYIGATVAAIPGSAITAVGGGLFGTLWGTVYVSVGSTTGAALCFLIARYIARDSLKASLEKSRLFQRIDRLTEQQGHIIVALTRLNPLFPFNLLNYGFGLTRIPFWTYVGWSWLCMLPFTVVYVAGFDALTRFVTEGEVSVPPLVAVGSALLILVLVVKKDRARLEDD